MADHPQHFPLFFRLLKLELLVEIVEKVQVEGIVKGVGVCVRPRLGIWVGSVWGLFKGVYVFWWREDGVMKETDITAGLYLLF